MADFKYFAGLTFRFTGDVMEFLRSEKAVSEVVSQVFILSLTIIGISAITLFGVPSIYRLEDMANVRAAEQAFTALDSRVSSVIIGDSPMKTVKHSHISNV
ncbi:DUF7289 family protein, partial [Candidatus Methanoperedens nitratireducens]